MRRTLFASSLALALSILAGCDCSGALSPVTPCTGSDPIAGCGAACGLDRPCRAGLYCGSGGMCTADCRAGEACGSGGTCSADGRCVAGAMDGGPRDGQTPDVLGVDNTCAAVTIGGSRVTPNVILVIDRSGSMDRDFGSGTRWEVLEDALLATPDGLIASLQSSVRFGIAMYTDEADPPGCPDLITVPCAIDNYTAIETVYRPQGPGGQTPTGDSITAVMSMIATLAPVRTDPTIIVLATDGEPDTCEDGNDEVNGRLESVAAVTAAHAAGVDTYVLSVGTDVAGAHLQDVANAGLGRGAGDPDAPFWVATDAAGLATALDTIIGGVVSCQIELEGMINPAEACSGTVRLGTTVLECGTDWRAIDGTHIELLGTACDQLQSSGDELSATFPCGVVIF